MDMNRARQIINSSESIQVTHEGSLVWLEKVMDNNTAEITYFNSNRKGTVPVNTLMEK